MKSYLRIGLVGAVACGPLMMLANAQEDYFSRDKYQAVTERPQPEYDPIPTRLGAIIVNSNAELGVISNSNIFATDANEESDTVVRAGINLRGRTDWNNHEVNAQAAAFRNTYLDFDDESNEDYLVGVGGRLDVNRKVALRGNLSARQRNENRISQPNAATTDRPVEIDTVSAEIGANYRSDRIRWDSSVTLSEDDFQDGRIAGTGNEFDQDFRDNERTLARSRLSYAISPNVAVFGQAEYSTREYSTASERDSTGYALYGGFDFELQTLIRGDVAVGYFNEDRDSDALEDLSGVAVDGRLQWFPSRLTTVTLNARRSVEDYGLVEAASATDTRFDARVDHELRRNIILSAFGSVSDQDYDDIDRTDEVTSFGISGTYKLNRNVHTEAFVRRTQRDVSGGDVTGAPSFEADVIGITLRLYP